MKDKIFEPRERCEDMIDHRISTRNLAVVKFKPAKKIREIEPMNLIPLHACSALPTELSSQLVTLSVRNTPQMMKNTGQHMNYQIFEPRERWKDLIDNIIVVAHTT